MQAFGERMKLLYPCGKLIREENPQSVCLNANAMAPYGAIFHSKVMEELIAGFNSSLSRCFSLSVRNFSEI